MKMFPTIKKIALSSILCIQPLFTQAAIIDFNTYFTDTDSGLSWLDVTATVNRSYNDISSEFVIGGEFEGWRYATGVEFNDLLSNWTGISPSVANRTITTGTTPSVDGLVSLFGSTLDSLWVANFGRTLDDQLGYPEGEGIDYTLGITADVFTTNSNQRQVAAIWDNQQNGSELDFYSTQHRQLFVNEVRGEIGSFLVRSSVNGSGSNTGGATSVSEPKTMLLFTLGLIGIYASRKRK